MGQVWRDGIALIRGGKETPALRLMPLPLTLRTAFYQPGANRKRSAIRPQQPKMPPRSAWCRCIAKHHSGLHGRGLEADDHEKEMISAPGLSPENHCYEPDKSNTQ
jgi:hypothetical protein